MTVDAASVRRAAEILRAGGLVAFPTETVYGLGANAANKAAVRRIFEVKGRPAAHPLIVHVGDSSQLGDWAADVPDTARALAKRFWPGPLTLVFRKTSRVLDVVTGGQNTVAIRVPAHTTALALLREFGGGIAAPSANRFGRVSPTTADHVREDLGSDVDFVLDGGPCDVGLESTIVDVSAGEPAILRPGGVTREQLEAVLGRPVAVREGGDVRTSGQLRTHYAPRARVELTTDADIDTRARDLRAQGLVVSLLRAAGDANDFARTLYAALREADRAGADVVLAITPTATGIGLAVADRLKRASTREK